MLPSPLSNITYSIWDSVQHLPLCVQWGVTPSSLWPQPLAYTYTHTIMLFYIFKSFIKVFLYHIHSPLKYTIWWLLVNLQSCAFVITVQFENIPITPIRTFVPIYCYFPIPTHLHTTTNLSVSIDFMMGLATSSVLFLKKILSSLKAWIGILFFNLFFPTVSTTARTQIINNSMQYLSKVPCTCAIKSITNFNLIPKTVIG